MKKVFSVALVIFSFIFIFSGCGLKDNKNNISFIGTVLDVYSQSFLVGSIENGDFDRASVSFHDDAEIKFTLKKGQIIKVTALPEIRESYPVGVTAVKVTLISQPSEKDSSDIPKYNAEFFSIGNIPDGLSQIASRAINSETLILSSAFHLPVLKFDSKADFDSFIDEAYNVYNISSNFDENNAFLDAIKKYDDNYFKDNNLILIYDEEQSSSTKLEIADVKTEDETLAFVIRRIKSEPEADKTANWFCAVELSKPSSAEFDKFDAYIKN